ncbi:hypothetical protein DITRI_Ditri02bG0167300 [Diplodiscus trichospermus]
MAEEGGDPVIVYEPQPHPPMEQQPQIPYCIASPPPCPKATLIGFQHYLVMFGTTVTIPTTLVRQMGGGNEENAKVIQTQLFVAGLNTLLQTLFGTKLPAVIGGSYTFVPTTTSIILAGRFSDPTEDPVDRFKRIMRAIQGSLIVASTLQIILGFSGLWRKVVRLLSRHSLVPLVSLVGFGLYRYGFPKVADCVEIGLPELILIVFVTQYMPRVIKSRKHVIENFGIIFSVVIVWTYSHLLTSGGAYKGKPKQTQLSCRTDRAGLIDATPWIRIPYPFQWGVPSFDAGEAFAMMMASFVALVESTGAFYAVSKHAGKPPIPPSILSRGVGWQGVSIFVSGLFGTANGSSVSVENAGALALTRVGSRRVIQISAGFMIFFSIVGKFGALFASIPAPIIAALNCIFYAYVGAGGISFLDDESDNPSFLDDEPDNECDNECDNPSFLNDKSYNLKSFRTKSILGFSVFMGLSVPHYFNEYITFNGRGPAHTGARWFDDIVNVPFSSGAFVSGCVSYFLDNTWQEEDCCDTCCVDQSKTNGGRRGNSQK